LTLRDIINQRLGSSHYVRISSALGDNSTWEFNTTGRVARPPARIVTPPENSRSAPLFACSNPVRPGPLTAVFFNYLSTPLCASSVLFAAPPNAWTISLLSISSPRILFDAAVKALRTGHG